MKRILFIATGEKFPKGAFSFLQSLNEQEPICATGLFFCPLDYELLAHAGNIPIAAPFIKVREKEKSIVEAMKAQFIHECGLRHIKYHLHENDERWERELFSKETRFSDLAILSGELFCNDVDDQQPNIFLQEALHTAECPVMVVPERYIPARHLVIAYDGSPESVFAIKQFCYLMPQYTDLPTELVYIRDEQSDNIPDLPHLKKFAQTHFSSLGFSKLHFKAARYFSDWINDKHPTMLVTGAYGRSAFSYVTKKSFAEQSIQHHAIPVFIAHR